MKIEIDKKLKRMFMYGLIGFLGINACKLCLKPQIERTGEKSFPITQILDIPKNKPDSLEAITLKEGRSYEESALICTKLLMKNEKDVFEGRKLSELIKFADDPISARAMILCYRLRNGTSQKDNVVLSLEDIHEKKAKFDCKRAAITAAELLSDDGYPSLILMVRPSPARGVFDSNFWRYLLNKSKSYGHAAFIYRQNGKYGYIDINTVKEPVFDNMDSLITNLSKEIGTDFTYYGIINGEKKQYRTSMSNLKFIKVGKKR